MAPERSVVPPEHMSLYLVVPDYTFHNSRSFNLPKQSHIKILEMENTKLSS